MVKKIVICITLNGITLHMMCPKTTIFINHYVCLLYVFKSKEKKNHEYILKCVQTFLEEYEVLKEFNSSTQIWLHLVTKKIISNGKCNSTFLAYLKVNSV